MQKRVNPMRRKQIVRAILETLSMAGGYALEDSILMGMVNDLIKPPMTYAEEGVAKKFCVDEQWMRAVEDSADPGLKQYVITELGRNYLASF